MHTRALTLLGLGLSTLALSACGERADVQPDAAEVRTDTAEVSADAPATDPAESAESAPENPTPPAPTPSPGPPPPAPVETWQTLALDFNGFFRAVETHEFPSGQLPTNTQEMREAVPYDFSDGVELASYTYDADQQYVEACLTGPDVYLTLTITDGAMKRTVGTGSPCDFDLGDIVLELLEPGLLPAGSPNGEQVVKGEVLAAQVPALRGNPFASRD